MGEVGDRQPNSNAILAIVFLAVGVGTAIVCRDIKYVLGLVGCAQTVAQVLLARTERHLWLRSIWIAVAVASAVVAIVSLSKFNGELRQTNESLTLARAELQVQRLIRSEPFLVGADSDSILEYFDQSAEVANHNPKAAGTSGNTYWQGTKDICKRYKDATVTFRQFSNHRITGICLKDNVAYATGVSFCRSPGIGQKWEEKWDEAWRFVQTKDGEWRISAFHYGIPNGGAREVARQLGCDESSLRRPTWGN